jgi:hypothetical protein
LDGNLGLGAKGRIGLALGHSARGRIRLGMEGEVPLLVGPQRTHDDKPVIDLADGT